MILTVNGKPKELVEGATIAGLLEDLGLRGSPCAVEVNRELVPKARHAETILRPQDAVEIVTLVGGG